MRIAVLAPAVVLVSAGLVLAGPTYYVSPNGSDAADGLTPATAWKSVDKVSATPFQPGSSILFARGGEWRGQLAATSNGTVEAPITYGSYGSGAKPRFYGSDVLDKSAFAPVQGSSTTYRLQTGSPVYSVLASGNFFRDAARVTNNADATANVNYVKSTPNTWYYDNAAQQLYVNTGSDLAADTRKLTGVRRDDVVYSNYRSNLVFKDLVVDESAKYDAGYAFRVMGSSNVKILDSEAYRAGKHHFGTINSTGFVGSGLVAKYAMPDQGMGGATALVSYSDNRYSNTTSTWENVRISDMGNVYPAYTSHGEGLGDITLRNIFSDGAAIELGGRTTATDLTIVNAALNAGGATVDRVRLQGANAKLSLWGDATIRNAVIEGFYRTTGSVAAVEVRGENNKLEFSTITVDASKGDLQPTLFEFPLTSPTSLDLLGNIFTSTGPISTGYSATGSVAGKLGGDYNLYNNIQFMSQVYQSGMTLAQWQALFGGQLDGNSLVGAPTFVNGLELATGSLGVDGIPLNLVDGALTDFAGRPRAQGGGADFGAFESRGAIPEPVVVGLMLPVGLMLARRSRRRV